MRCPNCGNIVKVVPSGEPTVSYELVDKNLYHKKGDIVVPFYCKLCGAIKFPYRAIRDVVFIYPEPYPEKVGSIYLPRDENYIGGGPTFRLWKPRGVVLSVGPGYWDKKKRRFVPVTGLKVGDIVYFEKNLPKAWRSFEVEGTDGKMHKVVYCGYRDVYLKEVNR